MTLYTSSVALDSRLPVKTDSITRSIPLPNAAVPVMMYFPEYNAILVPAESISPDYLPSSKRRKPIRRLVKLIAERMEGHVGTEEPEGSFTISQDKVPTSIENTKPTEDSSNMSVTDHKSSAEQNEPKPDHRPLKKPEGFLTEDHIPSFTDVKEVSPQPNTFGQIGQLFQRPNRPSTQGLNTNDDGLNLVPAQPNRPTLISFLPTSISNYFQNPPKLPFSGFFENRFPFISTPSVPRNPYVHYYTKTPTSEAFYYNSLHPSIRNAAYSELVQSEVTDYVNQVHESLLQDHDISAPDNTNSAMMVASVPMGKNQATSLLLRPVAKAVAGPKGVAVASPVAKAVLKKGEKVDIDFDPDAVAIAGPGGQAHAHPKLIVSYSDNNSEEASSEKQSA